MSINELKKLEEKFEEDVKVLTDKREELQRDLMTVDLAAKQLKDEIDKLDTEIFYMFESAGKLDADELDKRVQYVNGLRLSYTEVTTGSFDSQDSVQNALSWIKNFKGNDDPKIQAAVEDLVSAKVKTSPLKILREKGVSLPDGIKVSTFNRPKVSKDTRKKIG